MRPLKLVMEGFESYLNKTEIDFEKLGSNGLYIISGDTGAGKTTIFDAITYALYGTPSGDVREAKKLRSTQADENTETYVELTFTVNGQKYCVRRNPAYKVRKKRGEGFKDEDANAVLTFFDGRSPVEKPTLVNGEIQRILKLKADEFNQIIMIAQGQFEKFLLSETRGDSGKTEIFRNLFNTSNYNRLQERLAVERRELEGKYKDSQKDIDFFINGIYLDENSEGYEKLNQLKETKYFDQDAVSFLNQIVQNDKKSQEKLTDELKKKSDELSEINKLIGKIDEKSQIEKSLVENKSNLEAKSESLLALKNVREEAKSKLAEKDEIDSKKIILKNSLPDYEKISEGQKNLLESEKKLSALQNANKLLDGDLIQLAESIKSAKEEHKNLENAGENKSRLEAEIEKVCTEGKELNQLEKDIKELGKLADKELLLKEKAGEAVKKFEEENSKLSEMKILFLKEQAGLLAEELKEGCPCPVCGSLDHPLPAKKSEDAPSKEELDKFESTVKKLEENASQLSTDVSLNSQVIKNASENIIKAAEKYLSSINIENVAEKVSSRLSDLRLKHSELDSEIKIEEKNINRKTELDKKIPELEKKHADDSALLAKRQSEYSALEASIKAETKNLAEAKEKLEFESEEAALKKINEYEALSANIQKNYDDAEKNLNDCNNEISSLNGKITEGEKQLKNYESYDETAIRKNYQQLKEEIDALTLKRDEINGHMRGNEENVKNLLKALKEGEEVTRKFSMVEDLYKTTSGQLKGQAKVMLETFIQMNYLDQIVVRANQRLKKMTNNVYELVRSEESDGSGHHGLDLDVIDHHSGKIRSVKSLSGGEKFQASLALALGLSDEIQEASSGVAMESMFIDEGFATLDKENLKKVLKTLTDLSNCNKLIGIISHLDELEDAIPGKIEVKKDSSGVSSAKILS